MGEIIDYPKENLLSDEDEILTEKRSDLFSLNESVKSNIQDTLKESFDSGPNKILQNKPLDNESGKINDKQITEKETALYYSDLIIIQKSIKNFIDAKNFGNVLLVSIKDAVDTLNSIKSDCYKIIIQLTEEVSESFISEFNKLDFNNYKTFENSKEYNSYTKKFTTFKKLYDNVGHAFLQEDINKIFSQTFDNMFIKFKQSVINKGIIEKDGQLKQFRNELTYIKKVFRLFSILDCGKYKEIIDELSIKANPNKLPKKKKKINQIKEEDNNDANED